MLNFGCSAEVSAACWWSSETESSWPYHWFDSRLRKGMGPFFDSSKSTRVPARQYLCAFVCTACAHCWKLKIVTQHHKVQSVVIKDVNSGASVKHIPPYTDMQSIGQTHTTLNRHAEEFLLWLALAAFNINIIMTHTKRVRIYNTVNSDTETDSQLCYVSNQHTLAV